MSFRINESTVLEGGLRSLRRLLVFALIGALVAVSCVLFFSTEEAQAKGKAGGGSDGGGSGQQQSGGDNLGGATKDLDGAQKAATEPVKSEGDGKQTDGGGGSDGGSGGLTGALKDTADRVERSGLTADAPKETAERTVGAADGTAKEAIGPVGSTPKIDNDKPASLESGLSTGGTTKADAEPLLGEIAPAVEPVERAEKTLGDAGPVLEAASPTVEPVLKSAGEVGEASEVATPVLERTGVTLADVNEPVREATNPVVETVAPTVEAATNDTVQPILSDTLQPVLNDAVQPVLNEAVQPVLSDTLQPILNETVQPVLNDTVQPVLNETVQPVLNEVVQPILSDTLQPVLNDTLQPVLNDTLQPVLSDTLQPVLSDTLQPVLSDTLQPVLSETVQPVLNEAVQPVLNETMQHPVLSDAVHPLAVTALPPVADTTQSVTPAVGTAVYPSGAPAQQTTGVRDAPYEAVAPTGPAENGETSLTSRTLSKPLPPLFDGTVIDNIFGPVANAVATAVANGAQEKDGGPLHHPFGFPADVPASSFFRGLSGTGIGTDLFAALALLFVLSLLTGSSRSPRDLFRPISSFRPVSELPG